MNRVEVQMNYIGSVLSVNHYRGRRRDGGTYLKTEAKRWMAELGWKLKPYHIEDWRLPLIVTCSGVFRDRRSTPDLSNLSKVILDAIEDVTGINDRDMRWRDGTIAINSDILLWVEPYLIIVIEESEGTGIPALLRMVAT